MVAATSTPSRSQSPSLPAAMQNDQILPTQIPMTPSSFVLGQNSIMSRSSSTSPTKNSVASVSDENDIFTQTSLATS